MSDHLIRQLILRDRSLTPASRHRLNSGFGPSTTVPAGEDFVAKGSRPKHCTVVVSGWACSYDTLPDGRRQITAFHISGDFVDLQSFRLKRMDQGVGAISDCRIATLSHAAILDITETDPHLARLLWLSSLVDAAVLRQWLLSSGQRSALEHAAHLLCELFTRLRGVGMAAPGESFELPLSHADFAAALGISTVHVSRTLSELRTLNLFQWRGREAQILDWEGLQRVANFDPAYLMLSDDPR
ncbi:MAG: Crp/Fnr family transcriptional regulator [Steroidobacteraceae bacterium]